MSGSGLAAHSASKPFTVLFLIFWLVLPPCLACSPAHPAARFPLRLSQDHRCLVDQEGRPFFINGDAAWSLIAQPSNEQAERYMEDRARKGYNLVLVNLIEHAFADHPPLDREGQAPFMIPGDFGAPNEAYYAHADWVIERAWEKGILVLLDPLYLGYECGREGWCAEARASSPGALKEYGRYLGKRYSRFPNILWLIGGDADPVARGLGSRMRALVSGMKECDAVHLFTAHNAPEQAAMDVWPAEAWLDLNSIYTHKESYKAARAQAGRPGAKPFFLLETGYENERGSTALSLRKQAYWSVLSGGTVGHVFGNCPVWSFNAPPAATFCGAQTWQSQLNSAGSVSLAHVGRLFSSRAFYALVPDARNEVLKSGAQSGTTYAAAAYASDGSSIIIYVPTRRTFLVDLSRLSGGKAEAWWFDPGAGAAFRIGEYSTSGGASFTPPTENDWVLVLDSAGMGLPPPGQERKD
jgi:hypothetical protein